MIRATSGESLNEELSPVIEKLEEAMKLDDSNLATRIAFGAGRKSGRSVGTREGLRESIEMCSIISNIRISIGTIE